mgnify:CR=1 FL=1
MASKTDEFDIKNLLFYIKRGRKLFLASFLLFSLATISFQLFILSGKSDRAILYQASVKINFGNFSYLPIIMQKLGVDVNEIKPDLDLEAKIIKSDQVIGQAYEILDGKINYEKKWFIENVKNSISISKLDERKDKENAILITISWTKKNEAVMIANAIADAYYEFSQKRFKDEITRALSMVEVALSSLESILSQAYLDFATFSSQTGIIDAKYQIKLIFDSLQNLKDKLREVEVKIGVLQNFLSAVESKRKIDVSEFAIVYDGFEKIIEDYENLQIKRAELLSFYTEKHPKVIALDNQISQVADKIKKRIQFELEKLKLERKSILSEIEEINKTIYNLSNQFVSYLQKRERIDLINSLFENYYESFMNATLLGGVKFSMISGIEKAEFAYEVGKVRKNLSWIIFLSFMVGLIAGFISIYIKELFDVRFKDIGEVEDFFKLPILGILNTVKDDSSLSSFKLGVDGIKINIELLTMRKNNIIISVFSSGSGEGKTTLTYELAKIFSKSQRRTLLIDLNLRHSDLHLKFGTEKSPGIVDAVIYNLEEERFIKQIDENLYFIPSGVIHPSPSTLLSSDEFRNFLLNLKNKFDCIILDTSPLLGISDALLLFPLSDFKILVLNMKITGKIQSHRVISIANQIKSGFDGLVLNFVDEEAMPYVSYYVQKYDYGKKKN